MTRLKKILVAGMMVMVSCFTFLGTAMFNFAHSFFSFGSASASTFESGNKNTAGASTILAGDILTVKGIPTSAQKGVEIELPYTADGITTTTSAGVTSTPAHTFVEICNPFGETLTHYDTTTNTMVIDDTQVTDQSSHLFLRANKEGVYTVQYFTQNTVGVWTNTEVYQIKVASQGYKVELANNDSIVMPETIRIDTANASQTWAETTIKVALPLLYNGEGELIENEDIILGGQQGEAGSYFYYVLRYTELAGTDGITLDTVSPLTLTSENQNNFESYKGYTVKKVEGEISANSTIKYVLDVKATSSTGVKSNDPSGTDTLLDLTGTVTTTASSYYASAYNFEAVAGKNVVTYELYSRDIAHSNEETLASTLTHTITGKTSYDSQNISLAATPSSTLTASSADYMQKKYLPSVSAVNANENNNSINAFYYYTVKVLDSEGNTSVDKTKVVMGRDENGFYFIPKAASGTKYEFYYNVVDFYGNTVTSDDNYDYTITISDRTSPSVDYVESYDVADLDNPENIDKTSYLYALGSKYYMDSSETFKATKPTRVAKPAEGEDATAYNQYLLDLAAYQNTCTKVYVPAVYATDASGIETMRRTLASDNFVSGDSTASATIYINDNYGDTSSTLSTIIPTDFITFVDKDGVKKESSAYTEERGNALRNAKEANVAVIYLDPTVFTAGTYTLTLNVTDKNHNSNSANRTYTFEVVDETFTTERPTVTFDSTTVGNLVANQDVSISIPTITDNVDTRRLVKYFARIEGATDADDIYVPLSLNSDETKIEFNTSDEADALHHTIYELASASASKELEICAFVFNSFVEDTNGILDSIVASPCGFDMTGYEDKTNTDYDNLGLGIQTLTVRNTSDTVQPKFINANAIAKGSFDQNTTTSVMGVTFYDDTPNAHITATVVDTNGVEYAYDEVGATIVSPVIDGDYKYSYVFPGIEFYASNADKENYYTVTYTLSDSGNNAVSYSFVLVHATDKEGPVIQGIPGSTATIELGQTYYLTSIVAHDNFDDDADIDYAFECISSTQRNVSTWFNNYTKEFSPREVGTYQIKVTANDTNSNTSATRVFTVSVKDSLAPVISLNGVGGDSTSIDLPTVEESEITQSGSVDVYPEVAIPSATVTDTEPSYATVNGILSATGSIKISAPSKDADGVSEYVYDLAGTLTSNATNVLGLTKTATGFKFTPTARGLYTITYSGVDGNENSAVSRVVKVNVGDTESPEIVLASALITKLNNGFVIGTNDTLNVNIRARIYPDTNYSSQDIYVKDNYGFTETHNTTPEYDYIKVGVTISDESSSDIAGTTTDDIKSFTFEKAGTYTITFTVSDKVGNEETWSRTFVVTAKTSTSTDSSTILGTVLIIVSAVILVGVLIYFIKGTKILPKKNKVAKKEVKKEDKKD